MELEARAVERAPAGFGDGHDLTRGRRSVLGRVVRRQDLDLTHHVGRHREVLEDGHHPALAHEPLLHADAIERRLVARLQAAVDARVERVIAAAGADAWHQRGE